MTLWEWRKLRRRWMPWILLAIILVLMQAAQWFTYAVYHNESLQEFTAAGTQSFSATEEVGGELVRIEATCTSLASEGPPPQIEELCRGTARPGPGRIGRVAGCQLHHQRPR